MAKKQVLASKKMTNKKRGIIQNFVITDIYGNIKKEIICPTLPYKTFYPIQEPPTKVLTYHL